MKCEQFRKKLLEYPTNRDPDFHAHKNECEQCNLDFQEAMAFEGKLSKAFSVSVKEDFAQEVSENVRKKVTKKRSASMRLFSIAASLFLLVLTGTAAIHLYQSRSLGDFVIAHVHHELEQLQNTESVSTARLNKFVSQFELPDLSVLPAITYVEKCWMRTGYGLHLILQGQKGPVTLLFMPNEAVSQASAVEAQGFQGKLYTLKQGSFALVGIPGEPLEMLAEKLRMASARSVIPLH